MNYEGKPSGGNPGFKPQRLGRMSLTQSDYSCIEVARASAINTSVLSARSQSALLISPLDR